MVLFGTASNLTLSQTLYPCRPLAGDGQLLSPIILTTGGVPRNAHCWKIERKICKKDEAM